MRLATVLLMAFVAEAAITNVRVHVTHTQATISYVTPSASACTLKVSESPTLTPLVLDVDTTVFTGSNLDSRDGNYSFGPERVFVVGAMSLGISSDGERAYSRALQNATDHYFEISCGADTYTGRFTTAATPLGITRVQVPYTIHPTAWGKIVSGHRNLTDRAASWIDPHSGVLVKNVSLPGDVIEEFGIDDLTSSNVNFARTMMGTNWTTPNNILASDTNYASYSGASCSGTCDKLELFYVANFDSNTGFNYFQVVFQGYGDDASAENRKVYAFLSYADEYDPLTGSSRVYEITLPQSTPGTVSMGTAVAGDILRSPLPTAGIYTNPMGDLQSPSGTADVSGTSVTWVSGSQFDSVRHGAGKVIAINPGATRYVISSFNSATSLTLASNAGTNNGTNWWSIRGLHLVVWKKTNVGTIYLDHAKMNFGRSKGIGTGGGGNNLRCSKIADPSGFFWCSGMSGGGAGHSAYRIHGVTGEARHLGRIPGTSVPGSGFSTCGDEHGGFHHPTIYNRFYCSLAGRLYRWDYIGNGNDKAPRYTGHASDWTVTEHVTSIPAAIASFVSANSSHYSISYDTGKFSACAFRGMKNLYIVVHCLRGNSDTYGWIAVINDTGSVIAAMPNWLHPQMRWASVHSYEEIGDQSVYMYTSQTLSKNITGGGPYYVQASSAIGSGDSTIVVNSINPTSSYADTTLMLLAVNDVLLINNVEYVRITSISGSGPYTLGVTRGLNGSSAQAHSSGVNLLPYPSSPTTIGVSSQVWDFVGDPYGEDATGTYLWLNPYQGHQTTRRNKNANGTCYSLGVEGVNLVESVKGMAATTCVSDDPRFAGIRPHSPGLTYQTHPSWHNEIDTDARRAYFWADVHPYIGGDAIGATGAATLVGGTSLVYTWTRSTAIPTGAPTMAASHKLFAHYGLVSSSVYLKSISGPGSSITDADLGTFCEAAIAGECRAGSSAGNVYFNPGTTLTHTLCTGGENYAVVNDACLAPQPALGSALMQYGARPDQDSQRNQRMLAREALGYYGRNMGSLLVAKALGTGNWILARGFKSWEDLVLVKVPPIVDDGLARGTFRAVTTKVTSIPPGTTNIVAEFGYDPSYRCSENRNEKCLAVSSTLSESNPYRYPVEGTGGVESGLTGVSCSTPSASSPCVITIPALPGRVLYHRLKFRNSSNADIAVIVGRPQAVK